MRRARGVRSPAALCAGPECTQTQPRHTHNTLLSHAPPPPHPPPPGAVVLVVASYLLPLLVGLGVSGDPADWKLGYFAHIGGQVGG